MNIPSIIERTKNRSSRAILKHGIVHIRLARGLSALMEKEHIEILLRRIVKMQAREALKKMIDPFAAGQSNPHVFAVRPCIGRALMFSVVPGTRTRSVRTASGVRITRGPGLTDRALHQYLWNVVSVALEVDVAHTVRDVNRRTLAVPIQSISLKFMRSRWGSCSHSGNISLSTPLLFTTPEILEYVIIHELAHVQHMNHSKKFWRLVERYCPRHKERVRELRGYKVL